MTGGSVERESPVPEAVGRALAVVWERVGPEKVDQVWIFPPLIRGRKEFGLVAVSGFTGDPDQRILFTARYSAELTGRGVEFDCEIRAEGAAPPDRLPRVMDGVVRRSELQLADPEEVSVRGEAESFLRLARDHGWDGPPEAPPGLEEGSDSGDPGVES